MPLNRYLRRNSLPKRTSHLELWDRNISEVVRCNHKFLLRPAPSALRLQQRDFCLTLVCQLERVRVRDLEERGKCTSVSVISCWICCLCYVDLVPLERMLLAKRIETV